MVRYINGLYVEMTAEEIAEMERQAAEMPPPEPTLEETVEELRAQNEMLMECLLEISEIIYA